MPRTIKVLHFSPHDEACGLAKYQERFFEGMHGIGDIENTFFEETPTQTHFLPKEKFAVIAQKLTKQLKDYDLLHIQYEMGHFERDQLEEIIGAARKAQKPVIVTAHTAPDVEYKSPRFGVSPHNFVRFVREVRASRKFLRTYVTPLRHADLVLVHNEVTRKSFIAHGVNPDKITVIRHPVPMASFNMKTDEIRKKLNVKPGDIVYCTVGFMSSNKGTLQSVQALDFLPENYKLAIIGGIHPDAGPDANEEFYDKVTDLVYEHGLDKRVYITGYIEDDDRLDALIRECNICVYPYSKKYYSFVSSGSLNNAIANFKPVIAYPLPTLREMNEGKEGPIIFTDAGSYYELARTLQAIDIKEAESSSKEYASRYAWDKEAKKLADTYRKLV